MLTRFPIVATGQVGCYIRHYWSEDRITLKALVCSSSISLTPHGLRSDADSICGGKVSTVWTLDCLHMGLYTYTGESSSSSGYPLARVILTHNPS